MDLLFINIFLFLIFGYRLYFVRKRNFVKGFFFLIKFNGFFIYRLFRVGKGSVMNLGCYKKEKRKLLIEFDFNGDFE